MMDRNKQCIGCKKTFWVDPRVSYKKRQYCTASCRIKSMSSPSRMAKISKFSLPYNVTHNMSRTRIYRIWRGIKKRCDDTKSPTYKYYGGRGISYDPKWSVFDGFYKDMASGYTDSMTIERKDCNGNYNKANCCWIPKSKQSNNTRRSVRVVLRGKEYILMEVARKYKINYRTLSDRIKKGTPIEQAILKVNQRYPHIKL